MTRKKWNYFQTFTENLDGPLYQEIIALIPYMGISICLVEFYNKTIMHEFIRAWCCKIRYDVDLAILEFKEMIAPEICKSNINKLHEIIYLIIKNKGEWSNY